MSVKICHITSAHGKEDIRIFVKECSSLAKEGKYKVYLVQQGDSYEKNGVHIIGFGKKDNSRIKRFTKTARRAYEKALVVDADIYQIHDPELLPYAWKLKKKGKIVIFDSHEFNVGTIRERYYIPKAARLMISKIYQKYETKVVKKLDGIISVSPDVCEYFQKINSNTVQISNFPILRPFVEPDYEGKRLGFFGGVVPDWNHERIIDILPQLDDVIYEFAGPAQPGFLERLKAKPGWSKVDYKGKISHDDVDKELARCAVGLAILSPGLNTAGNRGTLGNTKIFEEMMAGLPVVCTNFDLWSDFIKKYECGILIDPSDNEQIVAAIKKLVYNPELCSLMGHNARKAVESEFCWSVDEEKLFKYYEKLCMRLNQYQGKEK